MLTAAERTHLEEYRADTQRRMTAYQLAAAETARLVEVVQMHLERQNFGLAKDAVEVLLESQLPNDHGGPVTHYPLFEQQLEKLMERATC